MVGWRMPEVACLPQEHIAPDHVFYASEMEHAAYVWLWFGQLESFLEDVFDWNFERGNHKGIHFITSGLIYGFNKFSL